MTDSQKVGEMYANMVMAALTSQPIREQLGATEPYEKKRLVPCPCCQTWLMKGSLGPKGCPTCGGAL